MASERAHKILLAHSVVLLPKIICSRTVCSFMKYYMFIGKHKELHYVFFFLHKLIKYPDKLYKYGCVNKPIFYIISSEKRNQIEKVDVNIKEGSILE